MKEFPVSTFERAQNLQRKTSATETDNIEPKKACAVALGDGKGRYVLGRHAPAADHRTSADSAVLMDPDETAQHHIVGIHIRTLPTAAQHLVEAGLKF
jgi:hypothetical protein